MMFAHVDVSHALPAPAGQITNTELECEGWLCNPGGVSPSLSIDHTCTAGPLLTGPILAWCTLCGLNSVNSKAYTRPYRLRVERPSSMDCSKVHPSQLHNIAGATMIGGAQ